MIPKIWNLSKQIIFEYWDVIALIAIAIPFSFALSLS